MIEPRHVHEAFDRYQDFLTANPGVRKGTDEADAAVDAFWTRLGLDDDQRAGVFAAFLDRAQAQLPRAERRELMFAGLWMLCAVAVAREGTDADVLPTITDADLYRLIEGAA